MSGSGKPLNKHINDITIELINALIVVQSALTEVIIAIEDVESKKRIASKVRELSGPMQKVLALLRGE